MPNLLYCSCRVATPRPCSPFPPFALPTVRPSLRGTGDWRFQLSTPRCSNPGTPASPARSLRSRPCKYLHAQRGHAHVSHGVGRFRHEWRTSHRLQKPAQRMARRLRTNSQQAKLYQQQHSSDMNHSQKPLLCLSAPALASRLNCCQSQGNGWHSCRANPAGLPPCEALCFGVTPMQRPSVPIMRPVDSSNRK